MSGVSFDGRNNIAYEAWLRGKNGLLTPRQKAQRVVLLDADKLCMQCNRLPVERRLCNGSRVYFDQESSTACARPLVVIQECHKLSAVHKATDLAVRLENTLLQKPLLELLKIQRESNVGRTAVKVEAHGATFRFDDKFDLPVSGWIEDDTSQLHREVLAEYVVAGAYAGYKTAYMRSNDFYAACFGNLAKDQHAAPFYRNMKYPDDAYAFLTGLDWLVLVNLHGPVSVPRFKGILFEAVKARFDAAKPTTLVLNQPFNVQNATEKELFDMVESWQKLIL